MKCFMNSTLKMLFSKVTLLTILFQWLLIAGACYQRGFWAFSIVHTNDGLLYSLVFLINLPALFIAKPFLSPVDFWRPEADSPKDALVLITTITVQWWIIGFFIKQIFFSNENKENIGKVEYKSNLEELRK